MDIDAQRCCTAIDGTIRDGDGDGDRAACSSMLSCPEGYSRREKEGEEDVFCKGTRCNEDEDIATCCEVDEYSEVENMNCGNCDAAYPNYGPNGERWQTSARDDVQACKATCSANGECGGFNFVASHQKCYFRNNDMSCAQSADTD